MANEVTCFICLLGVVDTGCVRPLIFTWLTHNKTSQFGSKYCVASWFMEATQYLDIQGLVFKNYS